MPITYYPTFKNSSGNVGIGTISPGYRLDVKATTTNGSTAFVIRNANDSNNFVIYDNGTASAGSDFRAPIFYDTNNTAYYLDPTSTSNLNAITLNNSGSTSYLTLPGSVTVSNVSSSEIVLRNLTQLRFSTSTSWDWNSWAGLKYDNAATTIYLGGPAATNAFTANASPPTVTVSFVGTNNVTSDSNFKGPIFYDSADTGYYCDPASTSRLNTINVGASGVVINNASTAAERNLKIKATGSGNGTGVGIALYDSSDTFRCQIYGEASNYGFLDSVWGGWDIRKTIGGSLFLNNNTTYYLNPASTTNLNNLTVAGTMTFGTLAYVTESRRSKNSSNVDIETVTGLVSPSGPTFLEIRGFCPPTMYRTTGDRPAPYGIGFGNGSESGGIMPIGAGDNLQEIMLYGANSGPTTFTFKRQIWEAATYDPSYSNYYGSAVFSINTGTGAVTASTDIRSPIFYDSNDTNYYVDPASTTNLLTLSVNRINNLRPYVDTWHTSTDGTRRFYFANGGTTYYSTANNYVFRNASDVGVVTIDGSGNLRTSTSGDNYASYSLHVGGTGYATADFRSPIFYDSNNTAYYVDPASTSILNRLTIDGGNYANNYFQSLSDFTNGTLVTTDIPATAANGLSFVMNVVGKSYNTTTSPFNFSVQGYLYNSTIINYSGLSLDSTGLTTIKIFENGGFLCFWWARVSYWNAFEVSVRSYDTAKTNYNRVTNITDAVEPTGTKKVTVTMQTFLRADVSATNAVDLRSPIFYDSNNTAYYCDPTGTSNFTGLTVANTITGSISGNAGTATILQTARNINGTSFNGSAAITTATWGTARTITIGSTGKSVDGSAAVSWSLAEIGAAATNQTMFIGTTSVAINRASASQTLTGVSIDGNAATVTNGMYLSGDQFISGAKYFTSNKGSTSTVGANNTYSLEAYSSDLGAAGMSFHRGGAYAVNMGLDPDNVMRIGGWSASANRWELDMSGNNWVASSFRSPIYYDSNDTSYYIDAASTSRLSVLYVASSLADSSSVNGRIILSGNLHIDAFGSYDIYCNYYSGRRFRTYKGAGTGSETFRADTDGIVYAFQDFRTPILYDYDNTNYYVDPASTSILNATRHNAIVAGSTSAMTSNGQIAVYSSSSPYISFHDGGVGRTAYFQENGGRFYFGEVTYTESEGSFRAPLFYDTNNTAYYCDPASTSILNSLTVTDGNLELYKSQTVDMSNTTTYSTSNYYPVTISVPVDGCVIQIQNNLNSNVPSWATHAAGFTLNLTWRTNGSGWGTTGVRRIISQYYEGFANQVICGGITQMTNSSTEVVWLRGGGQYLFKFSRNISATAQSTTYTVNSQSVAPTSTAQNTIWNAYSGAWTLYNDATYSTSNMYTPVLYDYNNSAYYVDPASTSNLVGLTVANTITGTTSGNLTSSSTLTAGNLSGTIPSAVLGNSTHYIGTTAIALNRGSASQSLTGVSIDGSSGSCTGNAATATTTDNINGRAFYNRDSGNVLGQDSYTNNGVGYVNSVTLFGQTDGGIYTSAYSTSWVHQIFGDFRTGQIAVRGKNSGTWQSWRTILDSTNYTAYSSFQGTVYGTGFTSSTDSTYYLFPTNLSNLWTVRANNYYTNQVSVTSSASTTINTIYNVTQLTLSASVTTLTFSGIQSSTIAHMWTVVTLGQGTAYSITWPAAVKWPGGTAPTLTTTLNKRDIYQFITYDGGTTIFAIIVGQNL